MFSILWDSVAVRLLCQTTDIYSARLLMNNLYMSRRSTVLTPVYFSFVSIDILEYADLTNSRVLVLQLPASSSIQHPRIFVADFWSIFVPFIVSLVTKSTLALLNSTYEHFSGFSFMRLSVVHNAS